MKQFSFLTVLSFLLALHGAPLLAAGDDKPGMMGGGMMGRGMMSEGMKGGGMMDMEGMRGHMEEMQRLMDRMHGTRDPKERHALMRKHRELMHQAMQSMRHMRWEGQECPSGEREECLMRRQQMMQQRMDMMQEMMNQMMQHQSMMEGMEK